MQRNITPNKQQNKCRIPDAINTSIGKNFTQIPNDLLRNPCISGKAKTIFCLLHMLSNQEEHTNYITFLKQAMKEGKEAIRSGLKELEQNGHLICIHYRDKKTKIRIGSFWIYTDFPGNFDLKDSLDFLEEQGLEPLPCDIKFLQNSELETLN